MGISYTTINLFALHYIPYGMCDQQYKLSRRCPGGRGAGPPDGGSRWTIDTSVGQWLFCRCVFLFYRKLRFL